VTDHQAEAREAVHEILRGIVTNCAESHRETCEWMTAAYLAGQQKGEQAQLARDLECVPDGCIEYDENEHEVPCKPSGPHDDWCWRGIRQRMIRKSPEPKVQSPMGQK